MRLAGCHYMVNDESGTHAVAQSRIVGGCGKRYSYAELRGIIPRNEPPLETKHSHRNDCQDTGEGLLDFRTVGHLLPEWNDRGRRGWATFQCPVHTVSGKHSDDHIHVNLADGAWTAHCGCDRKLIYQTICEMVGHSPKPTGRSFSGGMGGGGGGRGSGGSGGSGGDGKQPLAELSLRDRILEILDRNQERSHRDEAFIKLAQTTGATTREIKELATSLESEVDLGESRSERKTEIENLLRVGKYQLELQDYLDPAVAQPLKRVAGWMGTTPAAMLTTLYPVIGSLLKVGTRLELIKATDFYALPVVYTGLVCESGGGKSPAQKTIINPLFRLQDEAEIEYKKRLDEYQQELSEWKKLKDTDEPAPEQPVPREYYTTDATSEAIALIQSNQPNEGFLGWFDELPALFKSQGQYKNGRGADGEKILSGRDGTGFKVNRASGKRLVVNQSAYSITGSLQPLILRQMMGDFTDANGQWARFLWTVMQVQPAPYPDDAIPFDVSGLLKGIYKRLRNLPPITYTLSSQAQKLYRNWYNELDRLKMAESRQGLRAIYSKMKGDTGVLALLLHCFNGCVVEGSTPAFDVDETTMAAAIKLSKYHIGQVKLIHSEGDVVNGDVAAIHAKIIQLSERKGWLKAADVRDIDRQTKKQFSADDIRRHFQELEASGFGQTRGQRTKLMWSIYKDTPPDGNPPHSDQTQDSFEQLRTNSGQKSPNSGQTQDSLKRVESIANISVQQLVIQTQDTQDSFLASVAPSPNPLSAENEIKATDLNFCDLSCPELDDEVQNPRIVGTSEDAQTQGSCPENVLSCPEFKESDLSCPEFDEVNEALKPKAVAFSKGDKVSTKANPQQAGMVERFDKDFGEYLIHFDCSSEWVSPGNLISADGGG
jgi:hypothetical protein